MDEEARQNERVKKYQITIAQSMQLGTDIQQVLGNEKITDWVTREYRQRNTKRYYGSPKGCLFDGSVF